MDQKTEEQQKLKETSKANTVWQIETQLGMLYAAENASEKEV